MDEITQYEIDGIVDNTIDKMKQIIDEATDPDDAINTFIIEAASILAFISYCSLPDKGDPAVVSVFKHHYDAIAKDMIRHVDKEKVN